MAKNQLTLFKEENLKKILRGMSVHQKLAIILENKVVPEKNVFTKKWSPKLIFLNEFLIFGIEN